MDTLLLTCHLLFEQKQLSLQTACSGGLWVLLTGSDLFKQPRDKAGLPAHPGAIRTTTTSTTTIPPPFFALPHARDKTLPAEAGVLQFPPS